MVYFEQVSSEPIGVYLDVGLIKFRKVYLEVGGHSTGSSKVKCLVLA